MLLTRIRKSAGLMSFGCTVLLATAVWAVAQTVPSAQSPHQVADTLDGIVQPRFQKNAGRFGVDRVIVGGHNNIFDLDVTTGADRSRLRQVKQARRPFIIAFLHCVHKPGQNVGEKHPEPLDHNFMPYVDVLAAGTKTQTGADHLFDWGQGHLLKITASSLPQLKQGSAVETESGNWLVAMRPVRAERIACLGCHAGAKRGDTLGVMVYAVDKNMNQQPIKFLQFGGV
jgi:hypothetical protein